MDNLLEWSILDASFLMLQNSWAMAVAAAAVADWPENINHGDRRETGSVKGIAGSDLGNLK